MPVFKSAAAWPRGTCQGCAMLCLFVLLVDAFCTDTVYSTYVTERLSDARVSPAHYSVFGAESIFKVQYSPFSLPSLNSSCLVFRVQEMSFDIMDFCPALHKHWQHWFGEKRRALRLCLPRDLLLLPLTCVLNHQDRTNVSFSFLMFFFFLTVYCKKKKNVFLERDDFFAN